MKIVLTGIQPSGALHLGNYLGAMQPAVQLQEQGQAVFFIADYHALTTLNDPKKLREFSLQLGAAYMAAGVDCQRTILFRQSAIPEVHELAWLLSVVTPMGLLERGTSFKDKVAMGIDPNHGLFAYPVLMAADILLYGADLVPVGKDQKQHLEMARDIAQKFNDKFGKVFKLPEPLIREEVATVVGLDGTKMSKSKNNTLELFAEPKQLEKRIMSIATDSTPMDQPKPVN
jgi:tryptophanyl-tRNA synthetase